MGGHNRSRPCPSLGWMGVGGEQIFARDTRGPAGKARPEVRSSGFEVPKTSNFGPRTIVFLARPVSLARLSC